MKSHQNKKHNLHDSLKSKNKRKSLTETEMIEDFHLIVEQFQTTNELTSEQEYQISQIISKILKPTNVMSEFDMKIFDDCGMYKHKMQTIPAQHCHCYLTDNYYICLCTGNPTIICSFCHEHMIRSGHPFDKHIQGTTPVAVMCQCGINMNEDKELRMENKQYRIKNDFHFMKAFKGLKGIKSANLTNLHSDKQKIDVNETVYIDQDKLNEMFETTDVMVELEREFQKQNFQSQSIFQNITTAEINAVIYELVDELNKNKQKKKLEREKEEKEKEENVEIKEEEVKENKDEQKQSINQYFTFGDTKETNETDNTNNSNNEKEDIKEEIKEVKEEIKEKEKEEVKEEKEIKESNQNNETKITRLSIRKPKSSLSLKITIDNSVTDKKEEKEIKETKENLTEKSEKSEKQDEIKTPKSNELIQSPKQETTEKPKRSATPISDHSRKSRKHSLIKSPTENLNNTNSLTSAIDINQPTNSRKHTRSQSMFSSVQSLSDFNNETKESKIDIGQSIQIEINNPNNENLSPGKTRQKKRKGSFRALFSPRPKDEVSPTSSPRDSNDSKEEKDSEQQTQQTENEKTKKELNNSTGKIQADETKFQQKKKVKEGRKTISFFNQRSSETMTLSPALIIEMNQAQLQKQKDKEKEKEKEKQPTPEIKIELNQQLQSQIDKLSSKMETDDKKNEKKNRKEKRKSLILNSQNLFDSKQIQSEAKMDINQQIQMEIDKMSGKLPAEDTSKKNPKKETRKTISAMRQKNDESIRSSPQISMQLSMNLQNEKENDSGKIQADDSKFQQRKKSREKRNSMFSSSQRFNRSMLLIPQDSVEVIEQSENKSEKEKSPQTKSPTTKSPRFRSKKTNNNNVNNNNDNTNNNENENTDLKNSLKLLNSMRIINNENINNMNNVSNPLSTTPRSPLNSNSQKQHSQINNQFKGKRQDDKNQMRTTLKSREQLLTQSMLLGQNDSIDISSQQTKENEETFDLNELKFQIKQSPPEFRKTFSSPRTNSIETLSNNTNSPRQIQSQTNLNNLSDESQEKEDGSLKKQKSGIFKSTVIDGIKKISEDSGKLLDMVSSQFSKTSVTNSCGIHGCLENDKPRTLMINSLMKERIIELVKELLEGLHENKFLENRMFLDYLNEITRYEAISELLFQYLTKTEVHISKGEFSHLFSVASSGINLLSYLCDKYCQFKKDRIDNADLLFVFLMQIGRDVYDTFRNAIVNSNLQFSDKRKLLKKIEYGIFGYEIVRSSLETNTLMLDSILTVFQLKKDQLDYLIASQETLSKYYTIYFQSLHQLTIVMEQLFGDSNQYFLCEVLMSNHTLFKRYIDQLASFGDIYNYNNNNDHFSNQDQLRLKLFNILQMIFYSLASYITLFNINLKHYIVIKQAVENIKLKQKEGNVDERSSGIFIYRIYSLFFRSLFLRKCSKGKLYKILSSYKKLQQFDLKKQIDIFTSNASNFGKSINDINADDVEDQSFHVNIDWLFTDLTYNRKIVSIIDKKKFQKNSKQIANDLSVFYIENDQKLHDLDEYVFEQAQGKDLLNYNPPDIFKYMYSFDPLFGRSLDIFFFQLLHSQTKFFSQHYDQQLKKKMFDQSMNKMNINFQSMMDINNSTHLSNDISQSTEIKQQKQQKQPKQKDILKQLKEMKSPRDSTKRNEKKETKETIQPEMKQTKPINQTKQTDKSDKIDKIKQVLQLNKFNQPQQKEQTKEIKEIKEINENTETKPKTFLENYPKGKILFEMLIDNNFESLTNSPTKFYTTTLMFYINLPFALHNVKTQNDVNLLINLNPTLIDYLKYSNGYVHFDSDEELPMTPLPLSVLTQIPYFNYNIPLVFEQKYRSIWKELFILSANQQQYQLPINILSKQLHKFPYLNDAVQSLIEELLTMISKYTFTFEEYEDILFILQFGWMSMQFNNNSIYEKDKSKKKLLLKLLKEIFGVLASKMVKANGKLLISKDYQKELIDLRKIYLNTELILDVYILESIVNLIRKLEQ